MSAMKAGLTAIGLGALIGALAWASPAPSPAEKTPAEAHAEQAQAASPPPIAALRVSEGEPTCLVDAAALDDLKKRREALDARAKELASLESELKAKEKALGEELKKLDVAREESTQAGAEKKKENEERVAKLVEAIEGMSPKAAAQLVATIDEKLAVTAMQRLATTKLAKILNVMEPGRSSRLSESLAGVVPKRVAAKAAEPARKPAAVREQPPGGPAARRSENASQSAKGGESKNGHSNDDSNDSNGNGGGAGESRAQGEEAKKPG